MILTTTNSIDGGNIIKYFDPYSKSIVVGSNLLSDFTASITDVFGGRSSTYESKLDDINKNALEHLKKYAKSIRANAIVGIKLDVGEISGNGKQMFIVSVSGTPVVVDFANETGHESDDQNFSQAVNSRVKFKEILNSGEDIINLSAESVDFIINSGSIDFERYIYDGIAKLSSYNVEVEKIKEIKDKLSYIVHNYLLGLSLKDRNDILMSWLLSNDLKYIEKLLIYNSIKNYNILNYENAFLLLNSDDIYSKKIGLRVINSPLINYTPKDVLVIKQLCENNLINHFKDISKSVTEKTLIGVKNKWKCICGYTNSEKELYCYCGMNKKGFKINELTPQTVQETVNRLNESMNMFDNV